MAAKDPWEFVVISHSHWDREWYVPFQTFRVRLVRLLDSVLEILSKNPEYMHFMSDGQTVLLEDYLAVRPERRRLIARLVREGRLLVGPWYVAPDEFLPSGESLIRNLQRGIRIGRELGGAMAVGYSPDAFGHIAYLPAILRGFGVEYAVVWRGLGERMRKSEFIWESPDDSKVLTLHLPLGYAFAWPLRSEPEEMSRLLAGLKWFVASRATTRYVAVMNGNDHAPAQPDLPALLASANTMLTDGRLVQGNLPALLDSIKAEVEAKGTALPRYRGEMRSGQRAHLLPGAISARMWVKQRNAQCDDLLTGWLEPLVAWWGLLRDRLGRAWREPQLPWGPYTGYPLDRESIAGLTREAWRQLLLNQSHDPIYGCGVDAVYIDVEERFNACEQIAGDLARRLTTDVAAQTDTGGETGVVVFNQLGGPRDDFVTFEWPAENGREPPRMLAGADGRRYECQVLSMPPVEVPLFSPPRVAQIGFIARGVPGYAYKALRPVDRAGAGVAREASGQAIENEFFTVSADPADGSINLFDKASGRTFRGLGRLVDGGERGDEYNYSPPPQDMVIDRPEAPPAVKVIEQGPARWTLQIDTRYRLPTGLSGDRTRRSGRRVICDARYLVRLYAGVRRVEFRLEFDNRAQDHRLRAHFPTGAQSDVTDAEQHFGVVRRPIALPEADPTWMEQPEGTQPQKSFVDVNDGERGLLLANRGLPEYEALPGPGGVTLALTLLRCVGWLSRPDIPTRRGPAGPSVETPGAQCIGRHVFEYAVVPHEGGWQNAFEEAHRFARPLRAVVTTGSGAMPANASLVEAWPSRLVVSSVKEAEDGRGTIARVYNIGERSVRGRVRLLEPHGKVELVNLNEEPVSAMKEDNAWVRLRVRRNEVVSLLFHRRRRSARTR